MKLAGNKWIWIIAGVIVLGAILYYAGVFDKSTSKGAGKVVALPQPKPIEDSNTNPVV